MFNVVKLIFRAIFQKVVPWVVKNLPAIVQAGVMFNEFVQKMREHVRTKSEYEPAYAAAS